MTNQNKRVSSERNDSRTAAETYAARRSDIARLLDVLDMHLEVHAEGAKAQPADWGRVGDLGKVRSDLIDIVGFMANMDRKMVEEFLNEAI